MESDRRTFLRSLVTGAAIAAGGFGRPARAQSPSGAPGGRVAVLPVPLTLDRAAPAEMGLPFSATHVGLRWRGSEDDAVEIRWLRPDGWGAWQRLPIWDDTSDPGVWLVASGLVDAKRIKQWTFYRRNERAIEEFTRSLRKAL